MKNNNFFPDAEFEKLTKIKPNKTSAGKTFASKTFASKTFASKTFANKYFEFHNDVKSPSKGVEDW